MEKGKRKNAVPLTANFKIVQKKRFLYSKDAISLAVNEVRSGQPVAATARKFSVPESTLRAKVNNKFADKKPGPSPVLEEQEEQDLVDWITKSCRKGFPITKQHLFFTVKQVCDKLKKVTPFKDNMPGRRWYESFMQRHPELCICVAENVSLSRAKITEESLRSWFSDISTFLKEKDLLAIEPERIFNCDETGMPLNPKSPPVIAPVGEKNVSNIVGANEKENVSVLITANAAGQLAPTFVVFAGKTLPKNTAQMAPPDFVFGVSDHGYMIADLFYDYVVHHFETWLTKENVKRPVLMYVDGHSSHLTLPLSKFCAEKQIILIALHANATHIIQPLDVSFFKGVKMKWQRTYKTFTDSFASPGIKKCQFALVFKQTLDAMEIKQSLINGFKKCGLLPFDVEAIDFKKVFRKKNKLSDDEEICDQDCDTSMKNDSSLNKSLNESDICTNDNINCNRNCDNIIESFIEKDKLEASRCNKSSEWKGLIEDKSLFEFWYKVSHSIDNIPTSLNVCPTNIKQSTSFDIQQDVIENLKIVDSSSEINGVINYEDQKIEKIIISEQFIDQSIYEKNLPDIHELESQGCIVLDLTVDVNKHMLYQDIFSTSLQHSNEQEKNIKVEIRTTEHIQQPEKQIVLQNILNTVNINQQNKVDIDQSIKKYLPYPKKEIFKSTTTRKRKKVHTSSVISGAEWIEIEEKKTEEKRLKLETQALNRKIKLEKQEINKSKKEQDKVKRNEKALEREKNKLDKEMDRLLKQQERIQNLEKKKQKVEEKVLKDQEKKSIAEQLEVLQKRQLELEDKK